MYTSFYNLKKKPFQISSDPDFMWFGEKHKEALATLKYGILDNKGFLLLTGDVGTGKTTLINALLKSLDDDIICTSVPDPGLEKMDFFNFISAAFGIEGEFTTKGKFLAHFRNFLTRTNGQGKKVLLIIDEAQLLTQEMLEEIRLLSNIEKMDAKLINIFFVGQNEFNEILNREQNRAVRQRLTLNYNIDPLTPDETAEYIKHRLKVAGTDRTIFDMSATQEVFMYSGGFPRRINVICDHSLLSGYVQEEQVISASIVAECAKELKIPAFIRNRNINEYASYHDKRAEPEHKTEPAAQPVFIPSPQQQVQTMPTEKKGHGFLTGLMVAVIILILAGFLLFPNEFKAGIDNLGDRTTQIRQRIAASLPEPYGSVVYTAPVPAVQVSQDIHMQQDPDTVPLAPEGLVAPQDQDKDSRIKESTPLKNSESLRGDLKEIQPIQSDFLGEKTKAAPEKSNVILPMSPAEEKELDKSTDLTGRIDPELSESTTGISSTSTENGLKVEKEILPLPEEKVIIRFKYNTNDFTQEGYSKLVTYSEVLAMHPEVKVLVSGYTDSDGYQKYNRKLSEFRANIVRSFLLGRGIRPEQVRIKGLGSQNPIEDNATAWGRMMNRRVEIEILE